MGGFGLSIRTEDIARFGQLYLQKGEWQGKQLIPASWVETATARQMSNGSSPASDWEQGYGYQFWRCRHGFYRGDGAHGQFCIILPQYDAVIAMTSGTRDMPGVLNLVWDRLIPALKPSALPADQAEQTQLTAKLSGLALPAQAAGVDLTARQDRRRPPLRVRRESSIDGGPGAGIHHAAGRGRVHDPHERRRSASRRPRPVPGARAR